MLRFSRLRRKMVQSTARATPKRLVVEQLESRSLMAGLHVPLVGDSEGLIRPRDLEPRHATQPAVFVSVNWGDLGVGNYRPILASTPKGPTVWVITEVYVPNRPAPSATPPTTPLGGEGESSEGLPTIPTSLPTTAGKTESSEPATTVSGVTSDRPVIVPNVPDLPRTAVSGGITIITVDNSARSAPVTVRLADATAGLSWQAAERREFVTDSSGMTMGLTNIANSADSWTANVLNTRANLSKSATVVSSRGPETTDELANDPRRDDDLRDDAGPDDGSGSGFHVERRKFRRLAGVSTEAQHRSTPLAPIAMSTDVIDRVLAELARDRTATCSTDDDSADVAENGIPVAEDGLIEIALDRQAVEQREASAGK